MNRTLLCAGAVIGAGLLAGTAWAAANSLNFETWKGQPVATGMIDGSRFPGIAFESAIQRACIRSWPYVAASEANVVVGARTGDAGPPVCDATQPVTVRITGGGGVKYVGFYVVGKNPAGWDIRAVGLNGQELDIDRAEQGSNPGRTSRWVSATDPAGGITRVYVTPSAGSAAGVEFGLDDVT